MTDPGGTTSYSYDQMGNLVMETRSIGGLDYVIRYEYDPAGIPIGNPESGSIPLKRVTFKA